MDGRGRQVYGSIADTRVPVFAGRAHLPPAVRGHSDRPQRAGRVLCAATLARPRPRGPAVPRSAPATRCRATALHQSRVHRDQSGAGRVAVRRRAPLPCRYQRGYEVGLTPALTRQ